MQSSGSQPAFVTTIRRRSPELSHSELLLTVKPADDGETVVVVPQSGVPHRGGGDALEPAEVAALAQATRNSIAAMRSEFGVFDRPNNGIGPSRPAPRELVLLDEALLRLGTKAQPI